MRGQVADVLHFQTVNLGQRSHKHNGPSQHAKPPAHRRKPGRHAGSFETGLVSGPSYYGIHMSSRRKPKDGESPRSVRFIMFCGTMCGWRRLARDAVRKLVRNTITARSKLSSKWNLHGHEYILRDQRASSLLLHTNTASKSPRGLIHSQSHSATPGPAFSGRAPASVTFTSARLCSTGFTVQL